MTLQYGLSNIPVLHSHRKGAKNRYAKKSLNVPNVKIFFQRFVLIYAFLLRLTAWTLNIEFLEDHLTLFGPEGQILPVILPLDFWIGYTLSDQEQLSLVRSTQSHVKFEVSKPKFVTELTINKYYLHLTKNNLYKNAGSGKAGRAHAPYPRFQTYIITITTKKSLPSI